MNTKKADTGETAKNFHKTANDESFCDMLIGFTQQIGVWRGGHCREGALLLTSAKRLWYGVLKGKTVR